MSMLKKRISAFLLSLTMVAAVALPTFAEDTQSYTPMQISAESEAFPQAYIEIENGTTLMARDGTTHLNGASVTVYYEEHYKYDSQGNLFITDSRLLSEDEVNAIGKENFDEGAPSLTREVSNARGKLTIRMDGSYSTSGNSLSAFFSAMGNWSGTGSDSSICPADGADVAGFHWLEILAPVKLLLEANIVTIPRHLYILLAVPPIQLSLGILLKQTISNILKMSFLILTCQKTI